MTKVTVFGQEEAKKEEKKIEFMHLLRLDGESDICVYPQEYGNIVLLGEQEGYDLIMAWDDDASPNRAIFLGHWNDGVV